MSFKLVIRQCEIHFIRFSADSPQDQSPYLSPYLSWVSIEKVIDIKVKNAVHEQAASIKLLKEEVKMLRSELKEEKNRRRRLKTGLFSNKFINKLL